MALNLKLQTRLSQQLIMTPQLQQAIKLLQLSRDELEELVDQALIENPVLEEADAANDPNEESEEIKTRVDSAEETIEEPPPTPTELEWQEYLAAGGGTIPEHHGGGDGSEEYNLELTLARTTTLQDHLRWQLEMTALSILEMEIGEQLIGNIDDDGYLTLSLRELLESNPKLHAAILAGLKKGGFRLPLPAKIAPELMEARYKSDAPPPPPKSRGRRAKAQEPPTFEEPTATLTTAQSTAQTAANNPIQIEPEVARAVEGVLRFIQTLDPTGVGSRSIGECLKVQLTSLKLGDSLAYRMIDQELKLLESKDLPRIARRQKVDLELVIAAYKLILSLEPKPGRPFTADRAQHIIPDVFIYKFSAPESESEEQVGQFRVSLNETGMPRLKISEFYQELANGKGADSSLTKEYIQEKIKAGSWLMKSIEQRQRTIFRVTKSILKHQHEFFENGINHLEPLVLKDVAEDIDVHESTVSRITTNKYVHTPQGIFELKYFFTSGIDQGEGRVVSSKKIKDLIQKIVASEKPREPLTDIQIAQHLQQEAKIKVARRTIAKYREALNLLPSNKRRQMF